MALRVRTVTGTVVDGDGLPVTNGQVLFKPTKPVGYSSTHVVVDREFYVTTDTNGAFSASLWCDADSLTPINYTVTFPTVNSGAADPAHTAEISLAYEDGTPKDIGTLIAESTPAEEVITEQPLADLIDERIELAGVGASNLDALTDVAIASPQDGQILKYEAASSTWKNAANTATANGGAVNEVSALPGTGTVGQFYRVTSTGKLYLCTAANSFEEVFVAGRSFVGSTDLAAPALNPQTGTAYTLQASDRGKIVVLSNAGAITLTVPQNLGAGFNCFVVQGGAGQVTVAAGSGATVSNRSGHTKLAGQNAMGSIVAIAASTYLLGGDTAA